MANPKLQQLSEHVYCLPGGVNSAIVVNEGEALIVDSGQNKAAGVALRKACTSLGVNPVSIINSHAHADHYGGNAYLCQYYPHIRVYAPAFEAQIMQAPSLEPVYLFSGAKPLEEMMTSWLHAPTSEVHQLLETGTQEFIGLPVEIIACPGHAHQQCAVYVDGVLLAADALFGSAVLEKYPLPFGQDIGAQLSSAENLRRLQPQCTLPGHGDSSDDLPTLIDANLASIKQAASHIAAACQNCDSATVLQRSCNSLGISLQDIPRYYLNYCTVMAYLSYLREQGEINVRIDNNTLLWEH